MAISKTIIFVLNGLIRGNLVCVFSSYRSHGTCSCDRSKHSPFMVIFGRKKKQNFQFKTRSSTRNFIGFVSDDIVDICQKQHMWLCTFQLLIWFDILKSSNHKVFCFVKCFSTRRWCHATFKKKYSLQLNSWLYFTWLSIYVSLFLSNHLCKTAVDYQKLLSRLVQHNRCITTIHSISMMNFLNIQVESISKVTRENLIESRKKPSTLACVTSERLQWSNFILILVQMF